MTCGAVLRGNAGGELLALAVGERGDCVRSVFDDQRAAMRKGVAAELAGEGNVGQIQLGVRVRDARRDWRRR